MVRYRGSYLNKLQTEITPSILKAHKQISDGARFLWANYQSQQWTTFQGCYATEDDIYRKYHVWESSVAEISLNFFMELWEKENQHVNRKTEAEQQSRRIEKLCIKIRKLHNLRDLTGPSDDFIFPDDFSGCLENTPATNQSSKQHQFNEANDTPQHRRSS